jgi:cell division protein FtsZ
MGGGTGTGAAPIIAQAARELGVLTVGVVTKPFQFEGAKRMRQAEDGVEALQKVVDTLIIIPNQNLFRLANEKTTFTEAFSLADDVLYQGVKGVTDLMVRPGLINLDFADVRAVMDEMGKAMMGTGEDSGEDRAIQAAEKAIANPLLDELSLKGAKGVLINITGGHDLTLFELDEAANRIREEVDADANIIVGSTLDPAMDGSIRVSVVATGIDAREVHSDIPVPRRSLAAPLPQAHVAPEPAAKPAPKAEPAPVAAQVEEADEPTLFTPKEVERAAAEDQMEDIFEPTPAPQQTQRPAPMRHVAQADDDLPPPAYSPPVDEYEDDSALDVYVAPRAPKPGAPSPEAMARLQAAVGNTKARGETTYRTEAPRTEAPRAEAARAPEPHAERPRFGINSLLNRMTGHAAEPEAPRPSRQQPTMQAQPAHVPSDEVETERDEQIEIPAFLRRQAN